MDTYYGRLAALRNAAIARDWILRRPLLSWAEIMAACTKTVPLLFCSKCGSKNIALILSSKETEGRGHV